MPEESAQERTEEATGRRKEQARKKGTVARSPDLTNATVMVLLIAVFPALVANMGGTFMTGLRNNLESVPTTLDYGSATRYIWTMLTPSLLALAPLVGMAMFVGLASNFAQVGFVLSPEVLNPSLNKINPLNGFKRLLSRDSVFEAIKATLKTGLFGYVAWTVIAANWDVLLNLNWGTASGALGTIGQLAYSIFTRVAVVWLILAAVDYFYQRKRVAKQLRMTKEELKQEFKEMEQSPELKAAIAMRRRKLSRMRMAEAVRGADVIVTNPTHFSVALKYDREKMHAPQVVAKGQDLLALKMREIAKENRVPIVPHPPLARQLYKKCEVGDFVPRELFQAVAEVLAYVYKAIQSVRVGASV